MEKIERIKRELVYQGTILPFYRDRVRFSDGYEADWDFIHHKGAAAVVPVLPDGRLLLVRQYRNSLDRFTLELPAGVLKDAGENMGICAARELEEETGYRTEKMEWLLDVNTTVAFCDEKIGIYVAWIREGGKRQLDEGENTENQSFSLEELLEKIFRGEITDSKTVAGLLAYHCRYGASTAG